MGLFVKLCPDFKRFNPFLLMLALLGSASALQAAPQQFIVSFKDTKVPALTLVRQRVAQATGLQVLGTYGLIQRGSFVLQLEDAGRSPAFIESALRALPSVKFAHPDYPMKALSPAPTPNDALFAANQAAYMGPVLGASNYAAMNMQSAWGIARGSAKVVVAVLDSGALFEHPELKGRYLPGYDFVSTVSSPTGQGAARAGGSNDGDGPDSDASDPGDASPNGRCDGLLTPSSFHGTAVASVVAANTNNGIGMAGMNGSVRILPVRISGQCGVALTSDIINGMLWAVGETAAGVPVNPNPAKVVNLSFAGGVSALGCRDNAIGSAIAKLREKGALFVTAAGNGGGAPESPASCDGAVAVGTVNAAGLKAAYSAYGPSSANNTVLLTPSDANGFFLVASNNQNTDGTPNPAAHSVRQEAGTSFSAPMLSGLIALMQQMRPGLLPAETLALLKQTIKPFPESNVLDRCPSNFFGSQTTCACTESLCGDGIINPVQVLTELRSLSGQPVANVPFSLLAASGGPTLLDAGLSSTKTGENTGLTYQWRQVSGPAYTLQGAATSVLQVTAQTASTASARFELTVRDDRDGFQHAADVVVFSTGETPTAERVLSNEASTNIANAGNGGSTGTVLNSGSSGGGGGALGLAWWYLWLGVALLRRQAAVKLGG